MADKIDYRDFISDPESIKFRGKKRGRSDPDFAAGGHGITKSDQKKIGDTRDCARNSTRRVISEKMNDAMIGNSSVEDTLPVVSFGDLSE